MDLRSFIAITILISSVSLTLGQTETFARWCVTTEAEEKKCEDLVAAINTVKEEGDAVMGLNDYYKNATSGEVDYSDMPILSCVRAADVFDCMDLFDQNEVDLIRLEAGQGYFAGRYHSMRPILAEKYDMGSSNPLSYYAVAVKRVGSPVRINNLQGSNACIPGIGTGAGWVYPISFMLQTKMIKVTECNAVVKTVTDFFNQMCLPGALNSFYNPFGNNPTSVCELCAGSGEQKCTSSDPHAGFDGAFRCLNAGGDIAFLRHDTIAMSTSDTASYELVCPDGSTKPVDQWEQQCNFGTIPNDIIMTSSMKDDMTVMKLKQLFLQASDWFGPTKPYDYMFEIFSSTNYNYLNRKDLMFNDATLSLVDVGERDRYYTWVGTSKPGLVWEKDNNATLSLVDVGERDRYYTWVDDSFRAALNNLNECPIEVARLCVISDAEREKCESMVEVFRGKDIKPNLDCLQASTTQACMQLVANGDADMTVLDAGDVYKAGREFGLVPIAAEDYGDMTHSYKVVAAARKPDLYMTLFNLKDHRSCHAGIGRGDGWIIPLNIYIETQQFIPQQYHRSCHAGIGRGDGWIIPLNIYIETQQFIPQQCTIFENIGQLFTRACIPGALDKDYNPNQKPINLCEGCAGGGFRKCARNSDELYYGATGAFRCLVEKAGDVAFVHHLTVGDNTDGRNQAIWARNRRSDDYELLCKDGTRTNIENWMNCYLGEVPGAAIMTAGFKDESQRRIYWNLFSYGQQFFSSDIDGDFHMFDSGGFYADLIFSDEAVRLIPIDPEEQNYQAYLGWDFINQIQNLDQYQCIPSTSDDAVTSKISLMSMTASFVISLIISKVL